jgi:sigma-B regulation protein RsbU (phosphoserine phosphatase)
MPQVIQSMIRDELTSRRSRLERAVAVAGEDRELSRLLSEVDTALQRLEKGSYGLCETCHDPIEPDRLMADPLTRFCLDHLTSSEQKALEEDLDLAARIQKGLLPAPDLRHGNWEVAYHYEPLGPVSGDYCDLLPKEDGRLFFALGDAAGKGVAASMLMAHLNAMFRTLIEVDLPLEDMLERASRVFCESTLPTHYATLTCGWAQPSGELVICSAGHPPSILLRKSGASEVWAQGLPLGLFCQECFKPVNVTLEPGDALLLYSDGLTEARDAVGEEFGRERLRTLVEKSSGLSPRELVASCVRGARVHQKGAKRTDDLTVMAMRWSPAEG